MKNWMLLLFLCAICSTTYALPFLPETQTILVGGGNDYSGGPDFRNDGGDCYLTHSFEIRAANLVAAPSTLNGGGRNAQTSSSSGIFNLPAGHPSMFLKYQIGNQTQILPVVSFEADFIALGANSHVWQQIYTANITFQINLDDLCNGRRDQSSSTTMFTFTTSLITYDDLGNETPYPVCQFGYNDGIFSCDLFSATFPHCSDLNDGYTAGCDQASNLTLSEQIEVNCDEACNGGGGDVAVSRNGKDSSFSNESVTFSASPNPFNHTLQVAFDPVATKEILLMDINGKILKSWSKSNFSSSTLSINSQTLNLASGVYILSAYGDYGRKNIKMVKQ